MDDRGLELAETIIHEARTNHSTAVPALEIVRALRAVGEARNSEPLQPRVGSPWTARHILEALEGTLEYQDRLGVGDEAVIMTLQAMIGVWRRMGSQE